MQNRRAYPRYSLQHDALIVAKGFSPASCGVLNICAGGMCLADIDSSGLSRHLADSPGVQVEVHVFIRNQQGEQHITVLANVRRVLGNIAGIEFAEKQPKLLESLVQEKDSQSDSNILYTTKSKRNKLKTWFGDASRRFITPLLEQVRQGAVQNIDQQLVDSINLHASSELKYGKACLTAQQEEFNRHFIEQWERNLNTLDARAGDADGVNLSDLQVVDKGQFEDWLELQMAVSRIGKACHNELFMLDQFLSQIYAREVDDRGNPVAPVVLGQALHSALSQLQIPESARAGIYAAFEKTLSSGYKARLHDMVDVFQTHGLHALPLETIRTNWSDSDPAKENIQAGGPKQPASAGGVGEGNNAAALKVGRKVGNVLHLVQLHRNSGSTPQKPGFVDEGSNGELMELSKVVRSVQSELLKALSSPQQTLSSAVQQSSFFRDMDNASVRQEDWDIVELVDKIFAPVSQRKIPSELQGVINQLRIPLVNLLLKDQSFLEENKHPARTVLNHFMSLVSADRVSSKNLEKLLKQVVDELAEAGEISPDMLRSVALRLEELVRRQEKAFNRNAERIAKTHEGKQRLQEARRMIARRINTLFAGHQVPQVLLDLLDAGWEHAMVLAYLKEGGDSETVADYYAVLEQFFNWLDPECDSDGVSFERELESAALLDMVEREMAVSPDSAKARLVVKELRRIFIDEIEPRYVQVEHYPLEPYEEEPQEAIDTAGIDERWQERAHQLQPGEWLEVRLQDGSKQRMRLVWVGENAFKFVFLNPQGLHEVHYDYSDLLKGLQDGHILRVEEGEVPFVDSSLYGIVEELYQKMAFQAVHDPLTGCMNRHEIEKQLEVSISRAKLTASESALLVMDIDRFDLINSTYGSAIGDRMLCDFRDCIDHWLQDLPQQELKIGRTGSNEFALVIESCIREQALDLADRILRKFAAHKFETELQTYSSTLSIGVVLVNDDTIDAGSMLVVGTRCCKEAKRLGGNQIRLHTPEDEGLLKQQQVERWLARIDHGIDKCNLYLRAQRIQPMEDSGLPYYEILLGVQDDKGKQTSPEPFILAAEKYKKNVIVDTWVVSQVVDWMRANPVSLEKISGFTVNLSGHSLSDNQFMEFLEQQFRQGGFPAAKICFEVTETAAVLNLNYTADFMREIKRSGCHFALDDFGTGFSSYAYLQKLPVDFLKIDGVFVRDINENMTNYAMVKSISELSRFLGMATIAECVEDQAGLDALSEIGVEYVQGFYIEKPVLLSDL
ncbi:hypothetical protein BTA51_00735 [Hahella sp. CCB-MM4]|uniref:DUF1631 family protein n=1 Tax=Hahella sp. (strain CCB-MM4) TaxID=1926491 RepID=UPI000B9A27E9|nr:DUF1631 family protein [Hahella sp. CCB-MM4]OZG74960.1 hypothetical protein BTA51_00735 [Hahella sp. CCB-MM4]